MAMTLARNPEAALARSSSRAIELITPSGLRFWHVEDYTVPLLSLEFAFLGGAAQDPDEACGLTNLLAILLDEGAGPFSSAAFQEALEAQAIELQFDAGRDRIEGSLRTLAENADKAFELLNLALCQPRFDADAIERVKAQVSAALKREESDPASRARKALYRIAFPGHPYGRPVEGHLGRFAPLTREALQAQQRRRLARDNLRLVCVGAIGVPALVDLVERTFAPLPEKAALVEIPGVSMEGFARREVIDLDIPQSTLLMALPGIRRAEADYMPAMVLNHILGGGAFTSRLWTEVREKRGLAYSVWSTLASYRHAALFLAGTATSNERTAESLAVMLAEIAKIAAGGASAEELDKARRYLIGSYALRFDTSRKIAGQLLEIQIEGLGIDYIDRRNSEVAQVSLESMARVGERLFKGMRPLVVVAGRPANL